MVYESQKRYAKENLLKVNVSFNRKTDGELADWIEKQADRSAYLRECARADMERSKSGSGDAVAFRVTSARPEF